MAGYQDARLHDLAASAAARGDHWAEIHWLAQAAADTAYVETHERLLVERGLTRTAEPPKETRQ